MKIEKVMIPKTRPSGTRDHTCMSRVLLPIATHIEFDYYIQVKGGGVVTRGTWRFAEFPVGLFLPVIT